MKNKIDLKKLALLGITGGIMVTAQGAVNADENMDREETSILALGGCGGKGGCSSYKPRNYDRGFISQADDTPSSMQSTGTETKPLTESELLSQLNDEGKAIYYGLDADGKALALKLAAQTQDKNQAVKTAAQTIAQKKANMSTSYNYRPRTGYVSDSTSSGMGTYGSTSTPGAGSYGTTNPNPMPNQNWGSNQQQTQWDSSYPSSNRGTMNMDNSTPANSGSSSYGPYNSGSYNYHPYNNEYNQGSQYNQGTQQGGSWSR